MKKLIEKIRSCLFGWKLPCGHVRVRAELGMTVLCPVCLTGYLRARFVCKERRGTMYLVSKEDVCMLPKEDVAMLRMEGLVP